MCHMDTGPEEQRIRQALAARKRAEARLAQARQEERAAITAAIDSGAMRQVDVCRLTGYTREHVRRLALSQRADTQD